MDVLIANLVNASRAAGFCRGKGLDDTADNRAEDAALDALKAEIARLRALIMLGDFTNLRPNSDPFKLVQQIRREQSRREQTGDGK